MTTHTLTALQAGGCAVAYVVQIEGYDGLLTTGDPAAALTAWQSSPLPGHADLARAFSGLAVHFDQSTAANPWEPFGQPPICRMFVVQGIDATGAMSDQFAVDMLKRSGGVETTMIASVDPTDTAIPVRFGDPFSTVANIGPERIAVGGTDAQLLDPVTRGMCSPFHTDGGSRFARSHIVRDLTTATGDPIGVALPPIVTEEVRAAVGRWVGVWICRVVGGVFDAPEEAHLAFAGKIAGLTEGENGETVLECEHAMRSIYETRIMADPWQATLAEGYYLEISGNGTSGDNEFTCRTARDTSDLTANPLTVVAGAPASVNEIQVGFYTSSELAQAITAWLQAEFAASRIHFSTSYTDAFSTSDGPRGVLSFADATAGNVSRRATLTTPFGSLHRFLGWESSTLSATNGGPLASATGFVRTAGPPLRALAGISGGRLAITNERGTWIDQSSFMPPSLIDAPGLAEAVVKVGDVGHAVVYKTTGALVFLSTTVALNRYLTGIGGDVYDTVEVALDDSRNLQLSQVMVIESSFQDLLLKILLSTGAAGYNHADYDALPADLGCAIPFELLGDSFLDDVAGVVSADATLSLVIDKPTRFIDVFNVDFILRFAFLTWGASRLHLKTWGTPTVGASVVDLTESNKAMALEQARTDLQRSSAEERFEFIRNSVTVKYGRNATGDLVSSVSIVDRDSRAMYGDRGIVLEARHTLGQSAIGDVQGLIARFAATLPLFSRPHKVVVRTMDLALFEQLTVGTYCTITDSHVRNPETGLRGITGWPGIVVANRHDWGGSTIGFNGEAPKPRSLFGEVSVMIFDRISEAPYCPTAQVASYSPGPPVLTCEAHEHSTASMAADASHFLAGHVIRITEIDPASPSSALSWIRTISTVTGNDIALTAALSSPSYDGAKKYRITSAEYLTAASSQRVNAYQADDADGLVADTRQPYGMMASGTGQSATFSLSSATELPARYSDQQIGDAVAFDTGSARDAARLANSVIVYKSAPQSPAIYTETRSATVTGTRACTEIFPVFVGVGQLSASQTLKLVVAPQFRSKDGSSVTLRISLCRVMPAGASLQDVTLVDPYVSATFTTSSTTFSIPTAAELSCGHLALGPGGLGGVGWLVIEAEDSNAEYVGLPVCYVGPLVTAGHGGAGLSMRPALVHWQRDALNGHTPSANFYGRLASIQNHATAYRHRAAWSKSWRLGNTGYGYSGTTTVGRFRFRTGHGVAALRVVAIMGRDASGGSGTNPRATLGVDGGDSVTLYYGQSSTVATDAPDELRVVASSFTVSPDTAYTGYLDAIDYARVMAILVYELGSETVAESTEWFNATIPQARAPIFDAFQGRVLQGLSEIHRHNAGSVAHWSAINGASRTRSSATQINLVDNSTTGAPSAATPGLKLDLTYRATQGVATVPVEIAVYGSMASGTGTVQLRDSTNTVKATINVNSATPGWFTTTASLAASLEKYDVYFAGDGANTLSVSTFSIIEWTA